LTPNTCKSLYTNLYTLYNQHNYTQYCVWNSNEIRIQIGKQVGKKVLTKNGSNVVYSTIPKFREWLIINIVMNVTRFLLPRFYIFRRERLRGDYIKLCKPRTCMAIQKNAWMIYLVLLFLQEFCFRWSFLQ
jgi:hypothetical protein